MVKILLEKLGRDLLHCRSGNVMIITAASIVPLMLMGGSALDFGRVYLVKNRLQHACDASALAYRRSMNGTNVVAATEPAARKFFDANFNANRYGSGVPAITFTVDSQVVVHGVATVTLPLTIMRAFNYPTQNVVVACDAQLQLPNTDVMFVLDTTGSMTETNVGDATNKITALRSAVISFYNTLEAAKVSGTQVRYGFVPYSNTVNVGTLLKRDWVASSANYQSRVFSKQVQRQTGTQGPTVYSNTGWTPYNNVQTISYGVPENCVAPASSITYDPQTYGAWTPSSTALPRSRALTRTINGTYYYTNTLSDGRCQVIKQVYTNNYQTMTETYSVNPNAGQAVYTFDNYWRYAQLSYDVSGLKGAAASGLMTGGTINAPIATPASNATNPPTVGVNYATTWNSTNACIEERKTLRPGEVGTAYDMDVDFVPVTTNPDTQWKPFLPDLVFARNVWGYGTSDASTWGWSYNENTAVADYQWLHYFPYDRAACPSPSRKLMSKEQGLTLATLTTYINGLKTGGDTYHDIGFLWGVRLASAQGLFGSENTTAPNGFDISRNIIFMTDGATESHIQDYDGYGLSALDRRRTSVAALPTDAAQNSLVESRLLTYCATAKSKGMTVWVIAFGTSLTTTLQNCATSGRSYQANNAAALNTAFADIASRIAQLRLTK